jgi:hypothetical protein
LLLLLPTLPSFHSQRFVRLYETAVALIHAACRQYNGQILEPSLILFAAPADGVGACFQARRNLLEYNHGMRMQRKS